MRINNTKRRNGIIAAALGAALLMGGGTFALWSATADLTGGEINSGELSITTTGSLAAYDLSEDSVAAAVLADDGRAVTLFADDEAKDAVIIESPDTFHMVPGDTIALEFEYNILLVGNNLLANLYLDNLDALLTFDGMTTDNWDIETRLVIGGELHDGADFVTGAPLNGSDPLTPADSGSVTLYVIVSLDFGSNDVDDMGLTIDLAAADEKVTMRLQQVRSEA